MQFPHVRKLTQHSTRIPFLAARSFFWITPVQKKKEAQGREDFYLAHILHTRLVRNPNSKVSDLASAISGRR